MKAQFKILSGSRAGQVEVHSGNEINVGRHPSSDMRFHPDTDLDVSTRHAVIARSGTGWVVRDLESRNGTLVNGHKIMGPTRLSDTDQVRFGIKGPHMEFRAVPDSVPDTAPATFASSGPSLRPSTPNRPTPEAGRPRVNTAPRPAAAPPPGGSTTQRIRVEVARQTKKFRVISAVLVVVLLGAIGGFYAWSTMQERTREAQVAAMRDSTNQTLQAFQAQLQGLTEALGRSQVEVKRLQDELASAQATGDRTQIAQLARRLDEANSALRNQQAAAQVDFRGISTANNNSIALVYAKFAQDSVFTGTAFAIRKDGLLITNRHVVAGVDGRTRAIDLALKFANSKQTFRGSIVSISQESDLAIVRVEGLEGTIPVVRGINDRTDSLQPGDPVATIGFPLGVELPMDGTGNDFIPKTTFGAGTISKVLPDRIQIDGYSAQGASGSPIFDRKGDVVAVLYGGQEGTNGRVLYAVPAGYISKLLQSLN